MQVHWVEGIRSSGPEADGGFWKNGAIIGWWKYKSDQELRVFTSETGDDARSRTDLPWTLWFRTKHRPCLSTIVVRSIASIAPGRETRLKLQRIAADCAI
jgi:hypothetical protein